MFRTGFHLTKKYHIMTSSNGNILRTFSALLAICAGNSLVTGEFPAQRPVTRSFDVLFDLRLNKRLSKQSWGWRLETPSCPLWRYSNDHRNTELCGLKSSNWNNLSKTIPYSDVLYDHYKFELGHLSHIVGIRHLNFSRNSRNIQCHLSRNLTWWRYVIVFRICVIQIMHLSKQRCVVISIYHACHYHYIMSSLIENAIVVMS